VRNLNYSRLKCEVFYIAERSDPKKYRSRSDFLKLDRHEIIAIRESLKKIARRRIMDAHDAEDIVQDTLLTMITCHPEGELEKGLQAWSRGILRNKVGNYYRKSRRHAALGKSNYMAGKRTQVALSVAVQETTTSHRELRKIIAEKLAEFTPETRHVMELLLSGFKASEIAEHLDPEPYQNVINRLYRGRKKLARELVKCGFGPRLRTAGNQKKAKQASVEISLKAS
jgi:RNA polymerase sigma factor (sigma-70 family)